jgi:hypothetical protein
MNRIYGFVCENGHKIDRFVSYELKTVQCECGGLAHRALQAPAFRLEGWSGSFPSAHGKFEKSHFDKLKSEQKASA